MKTTSTKSLLSLLVALFIGTTFSNAESHEPKSEHLLDGTSMEYYYQNGSGVEIGFYDGKVRFEWISGPAKGNKGGDIPYMSRKLGDEMYLVSFHQKDKPNFVNLIFNFNENVMYGSHILRYGTDKERIEFLVGIIEQVKRD